MNKIEKSYIIEKSLSAWKNMYDAEQIAQYKARAACEVIENTEAVEEWKFFSQLASVARQQFALYEDIIEKFSLNKEWSEAFEKAHKEWF